jgi:hypothetical protein
VGDGGEPAAHIPPVGQDIGEVSPLGVVRAGGFLEVREARSVLDVEQGTVGRGPCDHVGAPCELVVLVWLIDRDREAERVQMRRLELTHRRMHQIFVASRHGQPSRIREPGLQPQPEGVPQAGIHLERSPGARLDLLGAADRDPRPPSELS